TKVLLISGLVFPFLLSCNEHSDRVFTYNEFREALYYNHSTGNFSELGNYEMCVNRWGEPTKWVRSMGIMNNRSGYLDLHTIIFEWRSVSVDGKSVEIHFSPDNSGITIEEAFINNTLHSNFSKHFIVKEFRLVQD